MGLLGGTGVSPVVPDRSPRTDRPAVVQSSALRVTSDSTPQVVQSSSFAFLGRRGAGRYALAKQSFALLRVQPAGHGSPALQGTSGEARRRTPAAVGATRGPVLALGARIRPARRRPLSARRSGSHFKQESLYRQRAEEELVLLAGLQRSASVGGGMEGRAARHIAIEERRPAPLVAGCRGGGGPRYFCNKRDRRAFLLVRRPRRRCHRAQA